MDSLFANGINAFLTVFLACLLYGSFGRTRFAPWIRYPLSLLAVAAFTAVLQWTETGLVRFGLLFLLTFALSFLFSVKTLYRFLYTLLYIALEVIAEGLTAMLISTVFSMEISHITDGLFYLLGVLISKLTVLFVLILIRLRRHRSLVGISVGHILILLPLPLSTLLLLVLQYNFDYVASLAPVQIRLLSVAYLLLVVSNIAVFDHIDSLYQNALDRGKLAAAAQIVREQEKQYAARQLAMQQHYIELSQFRHDQKNISIGILNQLKEGNTDAAIAHLQEQIAVLSAPQVRSAGIIHAVVDLKTEAAGKENIRLHFTHQNLQKIAISDVDIAILLGNALDNAIEAASQAPEEKRDVDLLVALQNSSLVICVKNPVSAPVDVRDLTSKKRDAARHGFGIMGMRQIVDKYRGEIVFRCEDLTFEVHVILPNVMNPPKGDE